MQFKNRYEISGSSLESERLKKFTFPHEVSKSVIGNMNNQSIIDIGAGPNVLLENEVIKQGGSYIGLDFLKKHLDERSSDNSLKIMATVQQLPIKNNAVDISHMRAVLMHLTKEDRALAIKEAIRVAKKSAIFIEFDWSTFKGSSAIEAFLKFTLDTLNKYRQIDTSMGGKLEQEITDCLPADVKIENSEEFIHQSTNYYQIITIAQSYRDIIKGLKEQKVLKEDDSSRLLSELDEAIDLLKQESEENPANITFPSLRVVKTIKTNKEF